MDNDDFVRVPQMKSAISVKVTIECQMDLPNVLAIWDDARGVALSAFALTHEEASQTLGPREDPDIEACVLMVLDTALFRNSAFTKSLTAVSVFCS